LTSVWS